jgi:hypothetical protein
MWGAGQNKEDDEGISIYLLLAANIVGNSRNLTGKRGGGALFRETRYGRAAWVTHGHRGGAIAGGPG